MLDRNNVKNFYIKVQKMSKIGYLVFFQNSIIVITLEKDFVKNTNKGLNKQFKAEKISIFKRAEMQNGFWENFGQKFLSMTVVQIIIEYKEVNEINYADIKKFKWTSFKEKDYNCADESTQDYLGELSLKTDSDHIWFHHRYKKEDSKFSSVLDIKNNLFKSAQLY